MGQGVGEELVMCHQYLQQCQSGGIKHQHHLWFGSIFATWLDGEEGPPGWAGPFHTFWSLHAKRDTVTDT